MINENYIEFKKLRDLGRIISDTINFLRSEWKPLLYTTFKASIIPVIITIGVALYYSDSTATFFDILRMNDDPSSSLGSVFLPLIAYAFAYAFIATSVFSYIKSYMENEGNVKFDEVNILIKNKSLSFLGLNIINGIIIGMGTLLCFFPGIYLGIVLSVSTCILIFQNRGVFDSIGDSFSFIKDHWWDTFGVLFVVHLLIFVISLVLNLPMIIYEYDVTGFNFVNFDTLSDPIYLILTIVSYIVEFVFYVVSLIATALIYFDIEEQKYPSTPKIIDEIGSDYN